MRARRHPELRGDRAADKGGGRGVPRSRDSLGAALHRRSGTFARGQYRRHLQRAAGRPGGASRTRGLRRVQFGLWRYRRAPQSGEHDAAAQIALRATEAYGRILRPPVDASDAQLREVERDRCAPEDFYSTTNHRTYVRHGEQWIEVENQRMDAMVVVESGRARCRRLRDLRRGDRIVAGLRGIRVVPESKERGRLSFAFMANGISSERQVETAVRQTAELVRQTRSSGLKVVVVAVS